MRNLIPVVLAALLGAGIVFLVLQPPAQPVEDRIREAYARAYGYYINENTEDYRRARAELASLADELRDSVAWRLDMALIDLAERNHPVQDQDRLLGEPSRYQTLLEKALDHLERALALAPDDPSVAYNLARTYKELSSSPMVQNEDELLAAAEELLRPLVAADPAEPAALILFAELRQIAEDFQAALDAYTRVVALGKDFVPETQFRVSEMRRAECMKFVGRVEEAIGIQEELAKKYTESPKATADALERGPLTEFLELGGRPTAAADPREMNWLLATGRTGLPEIGEPRFFVAPDLDEDCARDIVMNAKGGLRVLRNRRNGSFEDLTESAGLPTDFRLSAAAAGDLNNDGRMDLVLAGSDLLRVFVNVTDPTERRKWRFLEIELDAEFVGAEADRRCVTLWDLDHDGDLDIFAGGYATNRVFRTVVEEPDRKLRFVDVTEELGMATPPALDSLLLDVEDDQDVDLLISGPKGNAWFENLRQMRFERHDLPAGDGLEAADVDNDHVEEVRIGGSVHDWVDGKWVKTIDRVALLDLDGDGVIDDLPFAGFQPTGRPLKGVATDLNRDGGCDLVLLTDASLEVYMSRPRRPAVWIDVQPRGLKTNEMGIGTRLRLFAGDLRVGATCRDGLVSFRPGRRTEIDAILLRWTNGVEQGVVGPAINACTTEEEREGEVGSCPFLYTFDGERWHFIADIHSGTPLGLPYADGKYLPPRSTESVSVRGDLLRPVEGRLLLEVCEEFRELFYVDSLVLRAIDHPAEVRPVLDEGFKVTKHPAFGVHGLDDLRPPKSARDQKGRDILDLVSRRDLKHAVVWEEIDSRYVGLARPWSIELDFGDLSKAERVLLVMDGWVEFPTASASIAASQSETVNFQPPVIDLIGADGQWELADPDAGFPAGKIKSVLVDLTGKFKTGDGRIRIRSTQRLHWDAFWISTGADRELRLTELGLLEAEHGFRGVGRRVVDPTGELPWRYSHDDLVEFFSWDQLPMGTLTRYGDVKGLVTAIDDRYPVLASGDRIRLAFDASNLPPLPDGWVRDYCLTSEGWVKDADLNQAVREDVKPLPFHAMSGYPYPETEKYPHPDFVEEWFTRPGRRLVNPSALFGRPETTETPEAQAGS